MRNFGKMAGQGMGICVSLLASSSVMCAQSLPDAPAPTHDMVKPFSLSLSTSERFHNNAATPYGIETTVSLGVDYRLPRNRARIGAFYGYVPTTETHIITLTANYKLLEWGKRR